MAEHQIQRNRRTGEYRHLTERGWEPYTPMPAGTPERYLPGLADTPTTAILGELGRTGKEAAIGLARSPLDALKGLFQLVTSPVESVKGMASTVANPRVTLQALADNPREAGSLLGQLLLGKVGVPKIPGVAARVPAAVSAVGRGAETAGAALEGIKVGGVPLTGMGAAGAALQGQWPIVAAAAIPTMVKYGGQGLQKVGGGLERLKDVIRRPSTPAPEAAIRPPARLSTEVPYRLEARQAPVSENPLLEALPPPEPDAWSALRQLQTRTEPRSEALPISQESRNLAALKEILEQPSIASEMRDPANIRMVRSEMEKARRLTRGQPPAGMVERRANPAQVDLELPPSWQTFTENPVTQSLQAILDELRTRSTPGLTNPTGR